MIRSWRRGMKEFGPVQNQIWMIHPLKMRICMSKTSKRKNVKRTSKRILTKWHYRLILLMITWETVKKLLLVNLNHWQILFRNWFKQDRLTLHWHPWDHHSWELREQDCRVHRLIFKSQAYHSWTRTPLLYQTKFKMHKLNHKLQMKFKQMTAKSNGTYSKHRSMVSSNTSPIRSLNKERKYLIFSKEFWTPQK